MTSIQDAEKLMGEIRERQDRLAGIFAELKKAPAPCPLELGEKVTVHFADHINGFGVAEIQIVQKKESPEYYNITLTSGGWYKQNAERIARAIIKSISGERVD